MTVIGYRQISRRQFYLSSGFENPRLFRKASSKGWWTYWERID